MSEITTVQVDLFNNCGEDQVCQADFAVTVNEVSYLPERCANYHSSSLPHISHFFSLFLSLYSPLLSSITTSSVPLPNCLSLSSHTLPLLCPTLPLTSRDLHYQAIEVGGVEIVKINLTLSNLCGEDAIDLFLAVSHNITGVFERIIKIEMEVCSADSTLLKTITLNTFRTDFYYVHRMKCSVMSTTCLQADQRYFS